MSAEKTMACKDESYEVTGKVCPPKMPMDNVTLENWQNLPPAFLESLFSESSIEGSKIVHSTALCALLSQASVVLSSDGLSHSSVSLPYYFCNFCDHNTASKLNLLRHIAEKHTFKCQLCEDFVTFTRCGLIQHQLQKHVDAEEMQPVLSAKTVQLSTSELLRNIKYLTQLSLSMSNLPKDSVNSSLLNSSSKDFQTSNVASNFLTCVGSSNDLSSFENKDPDTSSIIRPPSNNTSDSTISAGAIESIFEDTKSKMKYNLKEGIETTEKNISQLVMKEVNRKNSNMKPSNDMPHFLNDSDTSVTSSSCRQYSLSPPMTHRPPYNATRHSEENPNKSQAQIPSFLCEPSPVVRIAENKYVKINCENMNELNVLQKMSAGSGEKENLKDGDNSSLSPSSSSSLCKQMVTTLKKDTEVRERSLSPNLSSLSVERLQKQLEEVVSNSPGFVLNESSENALATSDIHSNCTEKTCSTVDNFLMDKEDLSKTSQGNYPFTLIRSQSDGSSHKGLSSSANLKFKGENYDLLRNLLVQKPNNKGSMQSSSGKGESQLKFKHDKTTAPSTTNELPSKPLRVESTLSDLWLARASDMSLKELLTGSVPKMNSVDPSTVNKDVAQAQSTPIYLVCGLCNSEFHNKVNFHHHIGACKKLQSSQKESQKIDQTGINNLPFPNCHLAIKQEYDEEEDITFTGSRLSGEFTASGLLKSLTDQCLGVVPKAHRPDSDFHCRDNDSMNASPSGNHLDKQNNVVTERKGDTGKNVYEVNSTAGNGNLKAQNKIPATLSQNCVSEEETDRVKSNTRKRKSEYAEDADYVYDSEENAESDCSSESDYRPNSTRNLKKKKFIKDSERLRSEMTKRVAKRPFARQPNFYVTCLHCKFVTENRTEMRQHLILKHSSNVPFCKATFENQKDALLYFCCGVNSSCTFFSTEAAEIFQHIKLCYSGHLDHYCEHKEEEPADYAQVLCSLGIAAKKIDSSPSVFYCLRCSFSDSILQRVAYHVRSNHAAKVAGVMFINRMPSETKVLMACLHCNSHIPVKNWATHPCRKMDSGNFKNTNLMALNNSPPFSACAEPGKVSLLCELVAAEKGKIVQRFIEKTNKISSDLSDKQRYQMSETNVSVQTHEPCELLVKQEILDVEDSNDMPVYFPQNNLTNGNTGVGNFKTDTANNFEKVGMTGSNESASKELKDSSHSRVLQNLLSSPGEGDGAPKSASLLQNLLRSSQTAKEHLRLPSKPVLKLKSLPAQTSSAKYSTMLETLSRQASHTKQPQHVAAKLNISGRALSSPHRANYDTKYADAFHQAKLKESAKPDSTFMSSQKALLLRLPSNAQMPPSFAASEEVAQLSPQFIQRPPLLPLIPPLSPSRSEENQGSHVPFSNLLRGLLCKVNPRPTNSQNDPAF